MSSGPCEDIILIHKIMNYIWFKIASKNLNFFNFMNVTSDYLSYFGDHLKVIN